MIARFFAVVFALAVVVSVGCSGTKMATSAVDDSTFVRTMVDLQRLADDTTLDSLMRDSTRRVILRRHGLTAAELVEAARAMAYDPDHAERVWTVISNARTPGVQRARPLVTPGGPVHFGTPSRPRP